MAAVSNYINDPKGTLVVFNPLNWQRSGLVELDLKTDLELVDQVTGAVVPYQVLPERPFIYQDCRASPARLLVTQEFRISFNRRADGRPGRFAQYRQTGQRTRPPKPG